MWCESYLATLEHVNHQCEAALSPALPPWFGLSMFGCPICILEFILHIPIHMIISMILLIEEVSRIFFYPQHFWARPGNTLVVFLLPQQMEPECSTFHSLCLIMEPLDLRITFTIKVHKSNNNRAYLFKKNLFGFISLPVPLIQCKKTPSNNICCLTVLPSSSCSVTVDLMQCVTLWLERAIMVIRGVPTQGTPVGVVTWQRKNWTVIEREKKKTSSVQNHHLTGDKWSPQFCVFQQRCWNNKKKLLVGFHLFRELL